MPKKKLTALFLEKLDFSNTGTVEFWDSTFPGFGIRVGQRRKTWTQFAYLHGKKIRLKLGTYPTTPLAKAREEAREALRAIERGEDPRAKRRPDKFAPISGLVKDVVDEFIERHAKKNRTWKQARATLDTKVIPKWGTRPLSEITRRDVIELVEEIADNGTPYAANRTLACIKKLFSWSVARGVIDADPAAHVPRPGTEESRERIYTDDEIRKLWAAFDAAGPVGGTLLKLLLVTAQRRGEVAGMRRSAIDAERSVWTIAGTETKAKRSHEVPLSPLAVELIDSVPTIVDAPKDGEERNGDERKAIEEGKDLVFPGRYRRGKGHPVRPLGGFSQVARAVRDATGIKDFRIHDLRRTAGANMIRPPLRVPKVVVSRVLNHAEGGVTEIYTRYSYLDEKKDALDRWAARLDEILKAKEQGTATGG